MSDFDKTKENIGINDIDRETKKELYNKFVDAGGEVIKEKKAKPMVIDRTKQKEYQQRMDTQRKRVPQQKNKVSSPSVKASVKSKRKDDAVALFIDRLRMKFRLSFYGVSQFNTVYFKKKFLKRCNNAYKPSLMEVQMLYFELFRSDHERARRLTDRLDNMKPLFVELIEMAGSLFDQMLMDQIVDHYLNYPEVPKKVSDLREPLIALFRKIYLIKPYENTILNAFDKATALAIKMDKKNTGSINGLNKKLKDNLFIIFHKLYPRLYWLFCHFENRLFEDNAYLIEERLNITENDKPGNRVKMKPGEAVDIPLGEESVEEEHGAVIKDQAEVAKDRAMNKGLEIIYKLDFKRLRKEFDPRGDLRHLHDNDKILILFLLFTEFDHEYSFILTSNKIKFNTEYSKSGQSDYRSRLQALYNEMRKCTEGMKMYSEAAITYEKLRAQKPDGQSQYIQYSKRLEEVSKKRSEAGKVARDNVRTFMNRIVVEMKVLLDDMDGEQKYIINPQEELDFVSSIEGDKKLHKAKVFEAISVAYSYAMAFATRLGQGGDLAGKLVFSDEEMENQKKGSQSTDSTKPVEDAKPAEKKEEGSQEPKSILDELDDML